MVPASSSVDYNKPTPKPPIAAAKPGGSAPKVGGGKPPIPSAPRPPAGGGKPAVGSVKPAAAPSGQMDLAAMVSYITLYDIMSSLISFAVSKEGTANG